MSRMAVPPYLVPASVLASEPVEVTRAPELVLVDEKPKVNANFPGCQAYRMAVEVVRGSKQKRLLDGSTVEVALLDEIAVTVWTATAPSVQVGQYVRLAGVMVGAVEGSTYVQATGVAAVQREGGK